MILTDYYLLEKLPLSKSKLRYDVTVSTQSYEPLELLKNKKGELFFYYCDIPIHFKQAIKQRATKCISAKGKNISSVIVPDVSLPIAYGDIINCLDAILMIFNTDYTTIEIFVARGKKNSISNLYYMLADNDNEFNNEIETLRTKAIKQNELSK